MLTAQQKIELALRSAHLAKHALEFMDCQSKMIADLLFRQAIQDVKELDDFLKGIK